VSDESVCRCLLVGKTTLADALLASNGIISQRLAGKVNINYYRQHNNNSLLLYQICSDWLLVEWNCQYLVLVFVHFRLHKLQPVVTDVLFSVHLSVHHNHELCLNGWIIWDAVSGKDLGGPKEPCIRWGGQIPPLREGAVLGAFPSSLLVIGNIWHAVGILNIIQ